MANIVYNSAIYDIATGAIDLNTDTFKVMLVGSTYHAIAAETKRDSHTKRSDITDEVTGTGYSAGGATLASVTVTNDTTNNIIKVDCTDPSWTTATISGVYGAVFYKSRGGASSADELLCFQDLYAANSNAAVSVTSGTLSIVIHANGFFTFEPKSGS